MRRPAALALGLVLLTACAAGPEPAPSPAATATHAPVAAPTATPSPAPSGPRVKTDWSKLAPRAEAPQPVGEPWYDELPDHLIPADYGGDLAAYAGTRVLADWPAREGGGCLYGLMTLDGRAVTAPVYSAVQPIAYGVQWKWQTGERLPILALRTGHSREESSHYAFAAADGSWGTEFRYRDYASAETGLFAVTAEGCEVLGLDGTVVRAWTWADLGYSAERPAPFTWGAEENSIEWLGGLVLLEENEEQARVLDTETGAVSTLTAGEWEQRWAEAWPEREYIRADPYTGEPYTVEGDIFTGPMILRDQAGAELARIEKPGWYSSLALVHGLVEVVDLNTATYTDRAGNVVFRSILQMGEE